MKEREISFPEAIEQRLSGKAVVEITENHRSGDLVYRAGDDYILKVSDNIEWLVRERTVNDFLTGRLAVSETVLFVVEGEGILSQNHAEGGYAGRGEISAWS